MAALFQGLIHKKIPVTLSQQRLGSHQVFAESVERKKNFSLLTLRKNNPFQCDRKEPLFCLFRFFDHATFVFQSSPLQESTEAVVIVFPQVIYEVQRRKHPRVKTPGDSTIHFTPNGGTRVWSGRVKDISLEGTFCRGAFSPSVAREGNILNHLTLRLTMENRFMPASKVVIPSARVVRVMEDQGNEMGIGMQFKAAGDDLIILETYIDNRFIEENMHKGQGQ